MSEDGRARVVPTRQGYDLWAAVYDTEGNPLLALEEPEVERALGDVRGLDVLDVGCGTGRHAVRLALSGARVTAVDFSEAMLAQASAKPGADGVRFVVHDVTAPLPFAAASFDRVLSALVLEHIADLDAFFRELRRVCRSDGRVVISAMHPAMLLRGVSARFRDEAGEEIRPRSYVAGLSDYVMAALRSGLRIERISEHAVDEALASRVPRAAKYLGWPMLAVFVLAPA